MGKTTVRINTSVELGSSKVVNIVRPAELKGNKVNFKKTIP